MEILSITLPLFIFVLGGYIGKQKKYINDDIQNFLSKFVFYIAFPAMTFRSINQFEFTETFNVKLVAHNLSMTTLLFVISLFLCLFIKNKAQKGTFNMGCFRGNQGYMGLPIIKGFYTDQQMSKVAVVNCFDSIIVIFLSVISLEIFRGFDKRDENVGKLQHASKVFLEKFKSFLVNPFVLSAVIALFFAAFKIPVLEIGVIDKLFEQLSNLSLPLALISVGCSIEVKQLKKHINLVALVSFIKLIIAPAMAFLFGKYIFGFTGDLLGTSVILLSMPTSVSSFIMAKEMEADAELMATIIGFTTFLSVVTITIIQFILKTYLI